MLNDWTITGILILGLAIIFIIVSLCAIGLIVAEGESPGKALSRAVSSVTGGGGGPEHVGLSLVYYPLMFIGMLFITSVIVVEVSRRVF
jgi:hypothetical protein